MKSREQEVIVAFVDYLGTLNGDSKLSVDRWPDKENRTEPEIDAIAGDIAIEHTSIDSVANQRKLDDWYLQVVKDLDQVIRECVDGGLVITLDFFAIGKGMDWNRIRADFRSWIVDCAPSLGNGFHEEIILPTSKPTEFPIVMSVWKKTAPSTVGFARFDPKDDTLPLRIRNLLDRKAKKLRKYQESSSKTIILLENDDIALMNEAKMLDALREAYPDGLPLGVNEIWFADTSISDNPQFYDFTAKLVNKGCLPSPAR
ncbi:MAG: hypothetical protein OYG32_14805 [Rhodospirillaceae bacterium]|nr:hypothetical protein [Rhodospirillaceae bacterium]